MFKHTEYFDYKVAGARSNNCILIDTNNWVENKSNKIDCRNTRGGIAVNYTTEVLDTNIEDTDSCYGLVGAGDIVLLTTVATRIYSSRTFSIPVGYDSTKYTDIPTAHVIGKFVNKTLSLSSLEMLNDYVLLSRVKVEKDNELVRTTEPTKTVFEVLKVGNKVKEIKEKDIILIGDNITTPVMFDGVEYYACSESMVVAVFKTKEFKSVLAPDDLSITKGYTLATDFQTKAVVGGSLLIKPEYDESQDEYMSALVTEEYYRVITSDIDNINTGDVIYVPREATNYVTYCGTRYYTTTGKDYIYFKIRGRQYDN